MTTTTITRTKSHYIGPLVSATSEPNILPQYACIVFQNQKHFIQHYFSVISDPQNIYWGISIQLEQLTPPCAPVWNFQINFNQNLLCPASFRHVYIQYACITLLFSATKLHVKIFKKNLKCKLSIELLQIHVRQTLCQLWKTLDEAFRLSETSITMNFYISLKKITFIWTGHFVCHGTYLLQTEPVSWRNTPLLRCNVLCTNQVWCPCFVILSSVL